MKRSVLPSLGLAVALFTGCFPKAIVGDQVLRDEGRPVTEFSKITVSGACQVTWTPGKPALHISAEENLLPHIKTEIHGDTLKIDQEGIINSHHPLTLILSSSALADVELSGAASFKASEISGTALKAHCSGAAEMTLEGTVNDLETEVSGAGKLHAKNLPVHTAKVKIDGAGSGEINVSDTLKASINGAGSLTYSGAPSTVEQSISGAGSIRRQP